MDRELARPRDGDGGGDGDGRDVNSLDARRISFAWAVFCGAGDRRRVAVGGTSI